jgi:hypothetical protein
MPTDSQGQAPPLDGIILVRSGQRHTWLSTNEPLTPRRMELIQQLVGNAQWTKHSKGSRVKWRVVR